MPSLAYIPAWEGDETLYSWCARFHQVCGNGSARNTAATLFGAEHAVRERVAPFHIDHFVRRTHGALGAEEELLRTRTAIGLYWPFLSEQRRARMREHFQAGRGTGWVTLIGMPASALSARGLRYCECCLTQDLKDGRPPRWRLPHQLAGVVVCLDHGVGLRTIHNSPAVWLLPPDSHGCAEGDASSHALQSIHGELRRLARLAWSCIGEETIEVSAIREIAIGRLRELGASNWMVPLDRTKISNWFRSEPISTALKSLETPEARLSGGEWIHDLLRRRREEHPLLWMILWCALHASESEEFLARRFVSARTQPAAWDAQGQGCLWPTADATLPASAAALIRAAPTLKAAAKALGVSALTLRRQLQAIGSAGGEFHAPLKREQQRLQAIARVRRYLREHPRCSRTDIHRACKGDVVWLGRHEPEELRRILSEVPNTRAKQLSLPWA